jgi:hypothetical protein
MVEAYGRSGIPDAEEFAGWTVFATQPYVSATHGDRFVTNLANDAAEGYDQYEDAGPMPVGARIAKPGFTVSPDGEASLGPLALMEKMEPGFSEETGDWRYTMINADGSIFGITNGESSDQVRFCAECHEAVGDTQDHLFFLPEEVRVR